MIIDKRTPANIEYHTDNPSKMIVTRITQLMGVPIALMVMEKEITADLEFVLEKFSMPNDSVSCEGEEDECAEFLKSFCAGKSRVIVCRAWMDKTIHVADIS